MSDIVIHHNNRVAIIMQICLAFLVVHPCVAESKTYKCVANGVVSYQSDPCPAGGEAPYNESAQVQERAAGEVGARIVQVVPVGVHAIGGAKLAPIMADDAVGQAAAPGKPCVSGTSMPPSGALAGQRAAAAYPYPRGQLQGEAAYADGRSNLTPEQIKIGTALSNGDRDSALALIKAARDSLDFVVFRDSTTTPLLFATRSADNEMIAAILAKGIPVDSAKATAWRSNETALIAAVDSMFAGHFAKTPTPPQRFLETANVLLKAGANPNAKRSDGFTPLNTALRSKPSGSEEERIKIAMVKLLLENGATPDSELPSNDLTGEADVVVLNLLLKHGFDPRAKGSTSLASAVYSKRPALVKLLLEKGADPNAHALMGGGKVLAAADVPIAKLLLAAGANPNVCSSENSAGKCTGQPLVFSAIYGDPEYFRLLIAKGASPDAQDGQGETLLANVISYRSMQEQGIRKVCVAGTEKCMDVPESKFDRVKAAKMVLDAGANPNTLSQNQLPLLLADENDHALLGALLDKGAWPATLVVEGEKIGPISQVIVGRDYLPREMLRRTPGRLGDEEKWALFATLIDGRLDMAEELVRLGVNPNARGPQGETALHYAAMSPKGAEAVKRMIALGADPNVQTESIPESALSNPNMRRKQKIYAVTRVGGVGGFDGKMTPLMLAVVSHRPEVVRALLAGGAKVSIKSQRGWSALDLSNRLEDAQMANILAGRS